MGDAMTETMPIIADHSVIQVPMLSPDECARVLADVEALRPLWVLRRVKSERLQFHTLGAASYLDYKQYFERAAAFNAHLERGFGWLYERLLQTLRDRLHRNVAFEPRAARPGFHIWRPDDDMTIKAGNRHFDVQFQRINWTNGDRLDFSNPLSFTAAIRLPHSGGGLNVWPLTKTEYETMDAAARSELDLNGTTEYIPYHEGNLVCHSGFLLHTAASSRTALRPDDMRVTLQGHALWCEDTYLVYW
jgi:hypothetical protein